MPVLIFANGEIGDLAWIRPYLPNASLIIAADGGCRYLRALDQPPDVLIGDIDSLTAAQRAWLEAAGADFHTYPAAKDETDLELAVLYAVRKTVDDIVLFGATGGRLDQTLGNMLLLAHPALHGRSVLMRTRHEHIWLAQEKTLIHGVIGDTVSLIPLGGDVRIEQTTGLKWTLHQETLAFGPARGISNEMTAATASVTVESGHLLCIHTTQRWQR